MLHNKNPIRNFMIRFIWVIYNLAVLCHKGTVSSIQIIRHFASQVFKELRHFLQKHSSGQLLTSIYTYQAVMSRFIISDGSSWMRLADVIPGKKSGLRFSVLIQKARTENPALISTLIYKLLRIQLIWLIDFHGSIPVQHTGLHIRFLRTVHHSVSDDRGPMSRKSTN